MSDFSLDAQTALVIIDLQKGILGMPTEPRSGAEVLANAVKLLRAFRAKGLPAFLVRVAPSMDGKDHLAPTVDGETKWGSGLPPDWAELAPQLEIAPTDFIITKRQWGAFTGTELELQLRRRGVKTIVLCGISTNVGVESTARFAYELGFDQVLVEDAMAARTAEEHAFPLRTCFPRLGRVRSTQEVLRSLA